MPVPPLDSVASDARFFLHRADLDRDKAVFMPSSRARLVDTAFHDGRTNLTVAGEPIAYDLKDATAISPAAGVDRFLFHVSFCGSTLLARMFDVGGKSFSYREPQALIDLAEYRPAIGQSARLNPASIAFVRGQYRKRWHPDEVAIVKPSNWVNSFLLQLVPDPAAARVVMLDIDLEDFLVALFRGGRARIEYTLRFLGHLQTAFPQYDELVQYAAPLEGLPLDNAARLGALVLFIQRRAFAELALPPSHAIRHGELVADPHGVMRRTAHLLDVALDDDDIAAAVMRHAALHSKSDGLAFDSRNLAAKDRDVRALYGAPIRAAMSWARTTLGFEV